MYCTAHVAWHYYKPEVQRACIAYLKNVIYNHQLDRALLNNRTRAMVFNTTFNNISAISWQLVLLVEETHQTLPWVGWELTTLMVIGTDSIGNCKSHYYTIATMTAPNYIISFIEVETYRIWSLLVEKFLFRKTLWQNSIGCLAHSLLI